MRHILTTTLLLASLASPAIAQEAGVPDAATPVLMVASPDFVKMASSSNAFEIRSSEMAGEKAQSADVKAFAEQMIADHTAAEVKLKEAAGATAPQAEALAPKHAAMLTLLEGAQGADFEALYIDMQAGAHMEAATLLRTYSGNGDDPALKAFAVETLPKIEMHAMHIKEIVAKH